MLDVRKTVEKTCFVLPIPDEAPVTTAIEFANLFISLFLLFFMANPFDDQVNPRY